MSSKFVAPETLGIRVTPKFEFGIIAGGKNGPKGYNPMLQGDNDGVIGVETAKLDGARDLVVVPVLHSFIMDDAKVQEYVLRFMQHGCFVSEKERHPLAKRPAKENQEKPQ